MLRQRVRRCRVLSSFAVLVSLFYYSSTSSNDQSSFSTSVHFQGVLKNVGDSCDRHSTIVTAYYNLGFLNKHTEREFNAWNARFFRLSDSMVIFTDSKSLRAVRKARSLSLRAKCSRYIVQELEDTYTANLTDWRKHTKLDPEIRIHKDYFVYLIWNQKSDWLLQALTLNPFQSEHFFWADSGQFRDNRFFTSLKRSDWFWIVQKNNFIADGKVLLLAVEYFTPCELLTPTDANLKSDTVRIGGGNFGGDARALRKWRKHFYEELQRYINQGYFAGKDQPIMSSTCLRFEDLCQMIASDRVEGINDKWFAMQPVLHGTSIIPIYNPVRHIDSPLSCLRKTRQRPKGSLLNLGRF